MRRILVDSGSSIKNDELEKYNVELIPLKILFGEQEYFDDGIDLTLDKFYSLMDENEFPKTSLPRLDILEDKVEEYTKNGDEVIIVTISSKISGENSAIRVLFMDNPNVLVLDSKLAVGGVRLIVDFLNRNKDIPFEKLEEEVNKFIPRIHIMAIPETLKNLLKGGRLS